MARPPRPRSESDMYHVYTRGTGRQIIYEDDDDRRAFLNMLASSAVKTDAELFAYCLMGNHYHLVVKCDYDALPRLCFTLNRNYATYFNATHNRTGHLFQGRYSSQPIDDDSYLLAAVRYVHRNPVEAGMTRTCSYPWSSYDAYCGRRIIQPGCFMQPPLNTAKVPGMLGSMEAFEEFHAHAGKEVFADDHASPSTLGEKEVIAIARAALNGFDPGNLKALSKPDRDRGLLLLKSTHLTQSQIARLTGLSQSVVSRTK